MGGPQEKKCGNPCTSFNYSVAVYWSVVADMERVSERRENLFRLPYLDLPGTLVAVVVGAVRLPVATRLHALFTRPLQVNVGRAGRPTPWGKTTGREPPPRGENDPAFRQVH